MLTRRFASTSTTFTNINSSALFLPSAIKMLSFYRFTTTTTTTTTTATNNSNKVKVTFIDGKKKLTKVCEAQLGQTLLNVALANTMDIEAACDGTCACSTCHVYVDEEHFEKLPDKASEDEEDMLDLALDRRHNSRLCCQLVITKEFDGATLSLPEEVSSQV